MSSEILTGLDRAKLEQLIRFSLARRGSALRRKAQQSHDLHVMEGRARRCRTF